MKRVLAIAYCLLLWFEIGATAQIGSVVKESFNSSEEFKHWVFSNGAEFPGSAGTLTGGPGRHGTGAMLSFQFSCIEPKICGHYVAAIRRFVPALDLPGDPALRFWANVPPEVRLAVRLTDETGQTFQYAPDSSEFEQNSVGGWKEVTVSFRAEASAHWGGMNNGIFNGRLTQLAIVADARIVPSQSHLGFDDLSIGALPPVKVGPSSSILAAPRGSSILGPLIGVNLHQAPGRALDMAREAGFSFVRVDLNWQRVERAGQFDFSSYDPLRPELAERGLGVLWVLGYGHPSHGGKYPKSEEDRQAFGLFAAAAARHFSGPDNRFEIWNEPDNTLGDPSAFASIVQAGARAIRKSNREAEVSSGGISQWNATFYRDSLANCAPQTLSAIGFHGYRDRPETIRRDLASLQALIAETCHQNVPIWDTEWGYSSYSRQTLTAGGGDGHSPESRLRQAVLGAREFLCAWASGFPLIVWYDLVDDSDNKVDKESNFGLLCRNLAPKPVFNSIKALTESVKGHQYVGLVPGLPSSIHAMQLEGNLDILLIIWNDNAKVKESLQFTAQQLQSVTDLFGKPVRLSEPQDDQVQLTIAEESGPIYVRFKK